jgi:hypothetical protein
LWVYDLPGIVAGILGLEKEKNDMGLMVKGWGFRVQRMVSAKKRKELP